MTALRRHAVTSACVNLSDGRSIDVVKRRAVTVTAQQTKHLRFDVPGSVSGIGIKRKTSLVYVGKAASITPAAGSEANRD